MSLAPGAQGATCACRAAVAGTQRAPKRFQVRPDFVFRAEKIAVFVDGCFWHGCPLHATQPKQNAAFWEAKIARNRERDALVTRRLRAAGRRVLQVWAHELRRKGAARLLARLRRAGLV